MKIHYLSGSTIPSLQANSVNVMKMCSAFARNGHQLTLFARQPNQGKTVSAFDQYGIDPDFRLEFIRNPGIRLIGGALQGIRVGRVARDLSLPDLFYGRHVYSLCALARTEVPFIVEAHHIHPKVLIRGLLGWLFRRSNFQRLVVISKALAEDYLRIFPRLSADKVLVAHDGADLPVGHPIIPIDWTGRKGHFQVGYVGHLYPGKGMEVIAVLAPRFPEIDFHIVGGRDEDIVYWKRQTALSNVHFHGHQPHSQVPAWMERFHVVLAPLQERVSLEGGKGDIARWTSPLKVFEYMAHGKPILASNLPVLREVLEHGKTALLVDPNDLSAWCRSLRRLVQEKELRRALSAAALLVLKSSYTWDIRAGRVLAGSEVSGARAGTRG